MMCGQNIEQDKSIQRRASMIRLHFSTSGVTARRDVAWICEVMHACVVIWTRDLLVNSGVNRGVLLDFLFVRQRFCNMTS